LTETSPREKKAFSMISGRTRQIVQIVLLGVLFSLLTKYQWFLLGFKVYRTLPLRDEFFPPFFQSAWVYLVVYLSVLFLTFMGLIVHSRTVAMLIHTLLLFGFWLLCIHQQTYNDVTFLTCFWTVAWSTWFVWESDRRPEQELLEMAITFSHLVLSLIFLGGAVGKMTPGYWNGEVMHGIYFESRDFWIFNLVREYVPAENLPELAKWYSRMVMGMEWTCSFLWLMPPRVASGIALMTLFGIAFFSNFLLFSVVGCLLGLAVVGLYSNPSGRQQMNI
jgi:hypothetical protein